MRNFILLLISFVFVVSCVDVEIDTVFNKDKSGEVLVILKVQRDAIEILKEDFQTEDQFIDSFNLEGEISKEITNKQDVEFLGVEKKKDEKYYNLICKFSFKNVENFYRQDTGVFSVFLVKEQGEYIYRGFLKDVYQNIVTRNDSVYDDIPEITFKVKAFKKVKSTNFGEIQDDNMTVIYKPTQEEIESTDKATKWEVIW